MYNYCLAMYIISLLLYSDSESGSGDTQSSSCGSSCSSILHPVFFVPRPVTIVTIHSANSAIVHSGFIIQGVHMMTCLLIFIKICIHAFFSLSSSLFVLSHRTVRKLNPSQHANADWNRLLPYSAP